MKKKLNQRMNQELSVFKKFPNLDQANEMALLLKENNIAVVLVDNSPAMNITFSGNTLEDEIELKISQTDFQKAKTVLNNSVEISIEELDKNHYLREFSKIELYDILTKPDEWGEFDFLMARKLLESKGERIDEETINTFYKERINKLAIPKKSKWYWILLGYISSIFGGVIGIGIGWYLWSQKKTLPNGQKVNYYCFSDRINGRLMFFLGIVVFSTSLIIRFIYK